MTGTCNINVFFQTSSVHYSIQISLRPIQIVTDRNCLFHFSLYTFESIIVVKANDNKIIIQTNNKIVKGNIVQQLNLSREPMGYLMLKERQQ